MTPSGCKQVFYTLQMSLTAHFKPFCNEALCSLETALASCTQGFECPLRFPTRQKGRSQLSLKDPLAYCVQGRYDLCSLASKERCTGLASVRIPWAALQESSWRSTVLMWRHCRMRWRVLLSLTQQKVQILPSRFQMGGGTRWTVSGAVLDF